MNIRYIQTKSTTVHDTNLSLGGC